MFPQKTASTSTFFTIDFASSGELSNATATSSASYNNGINRGTTFSSPSGNLSKSRSFEKASSSAKLSRPTKYGKTTSTGPSISQFIGGQENVMVAWIWEQISQLSDPRGTGFLTPLSLFGASGVAKSSLGSLFAGTLAKKFGSVSKTLLCYTGKDFCRSFRQAEETNTVSKWRENFESKPVVFIDDIHNVCGHLRADKELKEILDRRSDKGLPSVFTCNQSPCQLPFSASLSSRFSVGLCLEVKKPGDLAKKEIVNRIFASHKIQIDDHHSAVLGDVYQQNIFAVGQVALRWKLEGGGEIFQPQNASEELQCLIQSDDLSKRSPSEFIKSTAGYFDLKIKDLKGTSRRNGCVKARSIAMWLCRKHLGLSYKKIGSLFGGRDHSTVINACRNIQTATDAGDNVVLCCVDHVLKNS